MHMSNASKFRFLISVAVVAVSASACGGDKTPAQSPGTEPNPAQSAEPSPAESAQPSSGQGGAAGTQGEHTMPNGEKMQGM